MSRGSRDPGCHLPTTHWSICVPGDTQALRKHEALVVCQNLWAVVLT